MVIYDTLQEKIRTILYVYQTSGTLQFVGLQRYQRLLVPFSYFLSIMPVVKVKISYKKGNNIYLQHRNNNYK